MYESHKILWDREAMAVWPYAVPFSAIVKRVSGTDQEKFDHWALVTELWIEQWHPRAELLSVKHVTLGDT